MKRFLLLTMLLSVVFYSASQTVTVNGGTYKLNETAGTATLLRIDDAATFRANNKPPAVSGTLKVEKVTYNGKTYNITELADYCFSADLENLFGSYVSYVTMPNLEKMGNYCFYGRNFDFSWIRHMEFPKLKTMGKYCFYSYFEYGGEQEYEICNEGWFFDEMFDFSFPSLETMGDYCFTCDNHEWAFRVLGILDFPNLTTMGNYCFSVLNATMHGNQGNVVNISFPKLTTMGNHCFYASGGEYYIQGFEAYTIELPSLKTMGQYCFWADNIDEVMCIETLRWLYLPVDVKIEGNCFRQGLPSSSSPIIYLSDADDIYATQNNFVDFKSTRFIVPKGKAAAVIQKWSLNDGEEREVYSPVPVSKTKEGYTTLSIAADDDVASFTYNGTTYTNYYDFNFALSESGVEVAPPDPAFSSGYNYSWYAATGYRDNNSQEGALTITNPTWQGVRPGEGFMLNGPVTSKLYVPVHTNLAKYSGTNYFKAGTGAAVAKESNGYRNFYYTNPTGFWECNNTVIPKGKAYLALPSSMTANAKTITFTIYDGETTGITTVKNEKLHKNDAWFTLDGRRLDTAPTQKGIYIHNGKKEVVR